CVSHQSTKEDGAEQRESRGLRIDPRREVSRGNSMGDQRNGWFACLGLEMVVKPPQGTVPLRPLDERWKAGRKERIRDDIGDMAKNALEFVARRTGYKFRVALLLKQLERIGDQRDLVWPMPVDRRFANASATCDRFYGERAITRLTEFVE